MLQILLAAIWLLCIPFGCGIWISSRFPKEYQNIGMIFLNGYLIMIAFFQCFYIAFLLAGSHSFRGLTWTLAVILPVFAGVSAWMGRRIGKPCFRKIKDKEAIALKVIFALFLLVQLGMRLAQQVSDGDDAYYIATAAGAYASGNMNTIAPYTGFAIGNLDVRHAFASAPIWLAFLSKVTGIIPAAMAHSVLSLVLILLHYIVILNVGELLFQGKKNEKYLFASVVSLFNIYGYVSIYTAQTFLLTRTWQGKSIFANLFLPALFLLLMWIGEKEKNVKVENVFFVFAGIVMFAGTAMTTLAVAMLPALFMLGILFPAIFRKDVKLFGKGLIACLPAVAIGIAFILV